MKKIFRAVFVALSALVLFSCTQYRLVDMDDLIGHPAGGGIRSLEDLENAVLNAKDGDTLRLSNVRINPESFRLPIELDADVTVTGSISVTEDARASRSVDARTAATAGETVIFKVGDSASVRFYDFSASVEESAAAELKAIISVDKGELRASNVSAKVSGSSSVAVNTVYLGANSTAENIQITDNNGGIRIDENNTDSELADKVIESNPEAEVTTPYDASNADSFEALFNGSSEEIRIRLTDSFTIDSFATKEGAAYDIDLNGYELKIDLEGATNTIADGASIKFHDGNLVTSDTTPSDGYYVQVFFSLGRESRLEFDGVVYNASNSGGIGQVGDKDRGLTATGSSVVLRKTRMISYGAYAIGTNAAGVYNAEGEETPVNEDVKITIIDSEVTAVGKVGNDGVAVMINVPGLLTIENSTITGPNQSVVVRGSSANISNSHIISTGAYNPSSDIYMDKNWGSGNAIPFAALVIGDRSTSYDYADPCVCNLKDRTTVKMQGDNEFGKSIYVSSDLKDVKLNMDETISPEYENDIKTNGWYYGTNTYINGEKLPFDEAGDQ